MVYKNVHYRDKCQTGSIFTFSITLMLSEAAAAIKENTWPKSCLFKNVSNASAESDRIDYYINQ